MIEQNQEQIINNLRRQVAYISQSLAVSVSNEAAYRAALDDALEANEQLNKELEDLKGNIEKAK